jgi:hypothetical protein
VSRYSRKLNEAAKFEVTYSVLPETQLFASLRFPFSDEQLRKISIDFGALCSA